MPSAHRNALKKLLTTIELRITEDEARLFKATSEEDRTRLIDEIADLHVRQVELKAVLLGEDAVT